MNVSFIVSFAGPDSANLLQNLAKFTHDHDGRWLSSKVNYLEGHIAANIKVSLPQDNARIVKAHFMAQPDIVIKIDDIDSSYYQPQCTRKLNIKANDRPGLVCDITHLIHELGAEIVHIEAHRLQVQPIGENVFMADVVVNLPEELSLERVISDLKNIDEHLMVSEDNDA